MDLARAFDDVTRICKDANTAASGWVNLVRYLERHGGTALPTLGDVPIEADIQCVRLQLEKLLAGEPPPPEVDAFHFGLFDAVSASGDREVGYYVAGIVGFHRDNGDALCNPAWWPDGRYLASAALGAIKSAELGAREQGAKPLGSFLAYAGQLGAALLVSRFAAHGTLPVRRCIVGFDSGDFTEFES